MATLRSRIAKYLITPEIMNELKPDVQKTLVERLPDAIKEAGALSQLEKADNPTSPYKILTQGPVSAIQYQSLAGQTRSTNGISFSLLREFSVFHWATRACISKRQEQIANLDWSVVPLEKDDDSDSTKQTALDIQDFFKNIGGPNRTFRYFLDMIVEDLLVLDAMTAYKVRNGAGELLFLHPVDGSTIRIIVDEAGMLLIPPQPTYKQYIRGKIVAELTTDELLYGMMNPRTNSAYGLSPLESLLVVIQSALHSEVSNLAIFKEGNVPEGFMSMPESWGAKEIKDFQEYWDGIMSGDLAKQRRLRMIPGGKGSGYTPTKKPSDMEFEKFEEWMTIKTCAMFGVSPQSIGITWDINKATATEQSMLFMNESIRPLANFLKEKFDSIIQKDLGYPDFEFNFNGFDNRDGKVEADINQIYVNMGVMSRNEVRAQLGEKPIDGGDVYIIQAGSDLVPLNQAANPLPVVAPAPVSSDENAQKPQENEQQNETDQSKKETTINELRRYRKKSLNDLRNGKDFRKFNSEILSADTLTSIQKQLINCETQGQIKSIFRKYIEEENGNMFDAAKELAEQLEKILSDEKNTEIKTSA